MGVRIGLGCRYSSLAVRGSQRNDPCIDAASVVVKAVHDKVAGLADRYGVSSTSRGGVTEESKREIDRGVAGSGVRAVTRERLDGCRNDGPERVRAAEGVPDHSGVGAGLLAAGVSLGCLLL